MKVFVSWSGGKDCTLALYRFLRSGRGEVSCLLNMCEIGGEQSRSHGLKSDLLQAQATKMNIPLVQQTIDANGYEVNFKAMVNRLKNEGITAGVFGDIYLQEHRAWIERVCGELGIEAIFPLWGSNTLDLLNEFVEHGFRTLTVSVRSTMLSDAWLGREINQEFIEEIKALSDIDPCAENGEYHSFVFDGPVFKSPVKFSKGDVTHRDNHYFLKLMLNEQN
jgi:uncharacterized protein (TIGR00290 family)